VRDRRRRGQDGFTLIEVLTVVVIIAILASILLVTFLKARAQSTVAASKANMRNMASALETYVTDMDSYPGVLGGLVPDYTRGIPDDPCTKGTYTFDVSMGGIPPTDYKLSVAYPLTSPCRLVLPGISYTPAGGLVESP
jgi:prepilin-type N-terminal cleavage/methylation domain-containing protein